MPSGPKKIIEEINQAKHSQQPVEQIQSVLVEIVVAQPSSIPWARGDLVHERHEQRAEEKPKWVRTVRHGCQKGLHASQRLLVEEFDQPHRRKHLRDPEDYELRSDPKDGRRRLWFPSLLLDQGGRNHGEGSREEADPDPLQGGDSYVIAGEFPGDWDEECLVERNQDDEDDVGDGLQWGWGDLKGGQLGVHGASLLDRESLELGEDGVEDDGAGKDRDHWEDHLHLLDFCHGAQSPWTLYFVGPVLGFDAGIFQEPKIM